MENITMAKYRMVMRDMDGRGVKRCRAYDMPQVDARDYWRNVTDVPCPAAGCDGAVLWHEAGYVPGYRICDVCGRHYLAKGTVEQPMLLRVGTRRG